MPRRSSSRRPARGSASSKPIHGRLIAHRDGYGFVTPDRGGEDIFLPPEQMHTAMHGDYVSVWRGASGRRGKVSGMFHEVLERSHQSVVGRLKGVSRHKAVIVPEDPRIQHAFEVTERKRVKDGDLVVADITVFPEQGHPGKAQVSRVLGSAGQNTDIDFAIVSFSLPNTWPPRVRKELPGVAELEDELPRQDLTDLPFVTIDGADAKDFDDAVCARRNKSGWTLWVAIADVAHYVRPGSVLDAEARKRGTSVYFPNRVIPMLPPELSEDLCSLRPEMERKTLVCEMQLGPRGALQSSRFYPARIRSRARLTYSVVDEAVFQERSATRRRLDEHLSALEDLAALYRLLHARRLHRGALDFDSTECRFKFDGQGQVKSIHPVVRLESHRLIEECMILANVAAAEQLHRQGEPGLYRIHDEPQREKIETLRALAASLSLRFPFEGSVTPLDCADLLEQVRGTERQALVERGLLRCQSLSVYSPDNIGHFGLALDHYAHFTSPIRRYPDLAVHRAIRRTLKGGKRQGAGLSHAEMATLGEHCSMAERRADEAVWDVEAAYKCRLAEKHVGKHFSGTVNTVTEFGMFVEMDSLYTEGLLHVRKMGEEYYRFESEAQQLRGERSGKTWQAGDRAEVVIQEVRLRERKISLVFHDGRARARR